MQSDDVTRIELEHRRRALDEYKSRCHDLRTENDGLKAEKERGEVDALQVISFLRRDAERKDELIEGLKKTIAQQRDVFTQQREREAAQVAERFSALEAERRTEGAVRQRQMDATEKELVELREFKEHKEELEEAMRAAEQAYADLEEEHREELAALERKFFEEKGRLQKEYKQMLAEMKKTSQEEAVERLDASTKKILFENRRMAEELRIQVQETDELQRVKKELDDENKKLRREVQLNEQSSKEYAKQGFRQSKEIKELTAKVKSLERHVSSSTREFEREKEALSLSDKKKLAEVELDTAGLRQLVRLKSKELAQIKRLAAVILQKRSEVETFLLESLEYVKGEIARRRAEEERASRHSKGRLPALAAAEPRPSNLPQTAEERVDIRDLTWEDRERVLRLLFAKINNSAPLQSLPPHALQPDDGVSQEVMLAAMETDGQNAGGTDPPVEMTKDPAFFMTQPSVA